MMQDLFDGVDTAEWREELCPGAVVLHGLALRHEKAILAAVEQVSRAVPFRRMVTPGGHTMSVEMTNCGSLGWVTDETGYRYAERDPLSGQRWPPLPEPFSQMAAEAADLCGFPGFEPDACLVNRSRPGTRLSLHQDRNERDFDQPIVSVSLGISAVFLFGGLRRRDKPHRVPLRHGDVVVWGGPARMRYHGVMPLKPDRHPLLGDCRINLTLRRAA